MRQTFEQAQAIATTVKQQWPHTPHVGIILGTGLGSLVDQIESETIIDYKDVPALPHTTAIGHRGRLICGQLAGVPLVVFQGRFHLYEGHTVGQTALPVRLLQALGVDTLMITNAAGGVNPQYEVGDIMLIDDQINLMFANPLVGINDDQQGPRFPDMSAPYDPYLNDLAIAAATQNNLLLHRGVYLSMLGPTYETRAEYRMARRLGADAVGMSTVPEVIAARHAGMRVLGLTTITNVGSPDAPNETTGHDVVAAAKQTTNKISQITLGIIQSLSA